MAAPAGLRDADRTSLRRESSKDRVRESVGDRGRAVARENGRRRRRTRAVCRDDTEIRD